ncbi:MAG: fatty acid desaturase [Alphaproteobacteria bacterium]|nr:MAG: fatty acid desaturase [Alphaproteobacteria bacterium]
MIDDISIPLRENESLTPSGISGDRQLLRRLAAHCHAYKSPDTRRALFQLATTAGLFFGALGLMLAAFHHGVYWGCVLLAPLAALLLVRLFIIQHDCGHGSFFPSRRANDWAGRAISVFTFTPYGFWRTAHNMHHAGSGDLDRRGIGSIDTLTVKEYQALPAKKRLAYRLYRNPFFLLGLAVPFNTFIGQRIPSTQSASFLEKYPCVPDAVARRSIHALNAALVVFYGLAALAFGWAPLLVLYVPVVILTSWAGGWLFFIQHQFERAHWKRTQDWNFSEAAVMGSSYYVLPRVLHWFTGNIGLHHIHHLCSLIPNYRLQQCLKDSPELQGMNRLTLWESLKCTRWSLWDEDLSKMVAFSDLKTA